MPYTLKQFNGKLVQIIELNEETCFQLRVYHTVCQDDVKVHTKEPT